MSRVDPSAAYLVYTQRARLHWRFDDSGPVDENGVWQQGCDAGVWPDPVFSIISDGTRLPDAAGVAYQDKVVRDYTLSDGSLKTIPAQRRKLRMILEYIVQTFTPGVRYSEKQVNQFLSP